MNKLKSAELMIVRKRFDEIKPHPKNPRVHDKKQIDKLRHSIKVHGFSKGSIVIQKSTGYILAGHGIVEALKAEGFNGADVVEADLPDGQAEAFLISDNHVASQSEWDNMALQNLISELSAMDVPSLDFGFDSDDLESLASQILADSGGYTPEPQDDEIPEVVEPITQSGDLWTLGRHRVLCGDSTKAEDVAKLMGGQKAELLFTSPPYSDMRDYNGEIDLSIDHLINFISTFEPYVNYQIINLGIQRKDNEIFPYWNAYINKAKEVGYKFLSWNIWNRESAKTIAHQSAMFPISHEWIFVFGYDRKELNKTKEKAIATLKDKRIDNTCKKTTITSVLTMQSALDKNETGHPARFPVSLPCEYLEAMTDNDDIICDPFLGSGSTLIACQKLNRVCYGMEIDQHYCDVILKRYIDFVGSDSDILVERDGKLIPYNELLVNVG